MVPNSIGFGHFSTSEDEHCWLTYSYDGLESSSADFCYNKLNSQELVKLIKKLEELKRIKESSR